MVPIDFHSMENKQYGDHQLFSHTHYSKRLLCLAEAAGLEQLEGEQMTEFLYLGNQSHSTLM